MKYILLMLLMISCNSKDSDKCESKIIYSVGGCGSYGLCGVTYTDSSYGVESFPSVNQQLCK